MAPAILRTVNWTPTPWVAVEPRNRLHFFHDLGLVQQYASDRSAYRIVVDLRAFGGMDNSRCLGVLKILD